MLLLEDCPNLPPEGGVFRSPLYIAAQGGHLEAVRALLSAGADANEGPMFLPLNGASKIESSLETISLLLESGADVSAKDHSGTSALHTAARWNNTQAMKLLLKYRPDINALNKDLYSALGFAATEGNLEAVHILLAAGAKIGTKGEPGCAYD
jgi:ankyrin repeat protein